MSSTPIDEQDLTTTTSGDQASVAELPESEPTPAPSELSDGTDAAEGDSAPAPEGEPSEKSDDGTGAPPEPAPATDKPAEGEDDKGGEMPEWMQPAEHPAPINPCTGRPLKDEPQSKDSPIVKAAESADGAGEPEGASAAGESEAP